MIRTTLGRLGAGMAALALCGSASAALYSQPVIDTTYSPAQVALGDSVVIMGNTNLHVYLCNGTYCSGEATFGGNDVAFPCEASRFPDVVPGVTFCIRSATAPGAAAPYTPASGASAPAASASGAAATEDTAQSLLLVASCIAGGGLVLLFAVGLNAGKATA